MPATVGGCHFRQDRFSSPRGIDGRGGRMKRFVVGMTMAALALPAAAGATEVTGVHDREHDYAFFTVFGGTEAGATGFYPDLTPIDVAVAYIGGGKVRITERST